MINIYNKDCLEAMKLMNDNQFDLAIVDPPYGIDADKKNNGENSKRHLETSKAKINTYKKSNWDKNVPSIDYFVELKRVSKNQIIWGVNYYPYDLLSGGRIYWDKCVTMPTYSDGELAYCSFINSIKSYKFAWHGMIQGDMKNKEHRIHPTQKPVKLYEWLLMNYAKDGDKILDTHLGSGSIAIACHNLGFDLEGYELDKEYYDNALKRIKQHQSQLRLI